METEAIGDWFRCIDQSATTGKNFDPLLFQSTKFGQLNIAVAIAYQSKCVFLHFRRQFWP